MKIWVAGLVITVAFGLAGCNRNDSETQDGTAARKAGRAAYELSQKTKEAAKKAEKEIREAGKEASQGWNEAKREDRGKEKK